MCASVEENKTHNKLTKNTSALIKHQIFFTNERQLVIVTVLNLPHVVVMTPQGNAVAMAMDARGLVGRPHVALPVDVLIIDPHQFQVWIVASDPVAIFYVYKRIRNDFIDWLETGECVYTNI